ncbi:hypothetical protein HDV05_000286 [Chytridiales sp. JEL 0842]|nr:hypothetical protein HDV05_000286 [Chytridiales sp. JEL 0842]
MPYAVVGKTRNNAFKVFYELHGEGPTKIVFIMGLHLPGIFWELQYQYFSSMPEYSCLVFDNRGAGLSDVPNGRFTTTEMAKDTLDLLMYVGWEKDVHVVGVSMGGMIATELTLLAPDIVASLTLTSTNAGRVLAPFKGATMMPRIMAMTDKKLRLEATLKILFTDEWLNSESKTVPGRTNHDVAAEGMIARFEKTKRIEPLPAVLQLGAVMTHYVSADRLKKIVKARIPVLVVTGTVDNLVSPSNSYYLAKILNAKFKVFEGCGHVVGEEVPEEYNTLLKEFIEESIKQRSVSDSSQVKGKL